MNWLSRKNLLIISFLGVFLYVVSYYNKILSLPSIYRDFCCIDDRKLNFFSIFIPLFVISAILFKYNKINFEKWRNFSLLYFIVYTLIYFIVPTQGDGLVWIQREAVSFFGTVIYLVISLGIIIYKYLKSN